MGKIKEIQKVKKKKEIVVSNVFKEDNTNPTQTIEKVFKIYYDLKKSKTLIE